MSARKCLGFLLLVCFPGVLQAQSAAQPCPAPALNGGYLVPEQDVYSHGTKLTYACDNGRKPAVEGWWATSTCHNGSWSHEPQCIDEKACFPPDIPNAKHTENPSGWYAEGNIITITCDEGYEIKTGGATTTCTNTTWSSVPICERSTRSCGEPPKVPHAVIIHQEYQEMFPANAQVQYECEDGYTVDGAQRETRTKLIYCTAGKWTEGPTCNRGTEVETSGGHTTPAGSGTRPSGGGSSTSSGSTEGHTGSVFTAVSHCGAYPNVPNGAVVREDPRFLKYECNYFYTRVGPDTVWCLNGRWSQPPICQEATFCTVTAQSLPNTIKVSGGELIKEGEDKLFPCIWPDISSLVQCRNGYIYYFSCCHDSDRQEGRCR